MIWIILGSVLVLLALYRLYFLLKPLLMISTELIHDGVIRDVKSYQDEIEQLRLELLTLNDAYYNEMNALEKRLENLENPQTDSNAFRKVMRQKTDSLYAERIIKPLNTDTQPIQKINATSNTLETVNHSKVMHPLFDRIRGLYRLGYKEADIAKELGIGISEVRLLIKRIDEL